MFDKEKLFDELVQDGQLKDYNNITDYGLMGYMIDKYSADKSWLSDLIGAVLGDLEAQKLIEEDIVVSLQQMMEDNKNES